MEKIRTYTYSYDNVEIREEQPNVKDIPTTIWIIFKPEWKGKLKFKELLCIYDRLTNNMYWEYELRHRKHVLGVEPCYTEYFFKFELPFMRWLGRQRNSSMAIFESHGVTVLMRKFKSKTKIIVCGRGEMNLLEDFHSKF